MYKKLQFFLAAFLFIICASGLFCQDFSLSSPENILLEINNAYKSGAQVNYGIVSACIHALMEQGDSSAYTALFSVLTSGYPEIIMSEAIGALEALPANLLLFLLDVIENNPPNEKFVAFRTGITSQKLTVSERGQLAELALERSFSYTEDNIDLDAMRFAAVIALTDLNWKRANPLAIRHYYRSQADFLQGAIPKDRLVEAIACLGAVGDSDAALILVLQLGLINLRTERTGLFDPDITMAIVQALGNIGDNAAFDNLLYASALPYGEAINTAAAESVARLKWQ